MDISAKIDKQTVHVFKVNSNRAQLLLPIAKGTANNKYSTHVLCLRSVGLGLELGLRWDGMGLRLRGQQAPVPSGVALGTVARLFALFTLRWRIV